MQFYHYMVLPSVDRQSSSNQLLINCTVINIFLSNLATWKLSPISNNISIFHFCGNYWNVSIFSQWLRLLVSYFDCNGWICFKTTNGWIQTFVKNYLKFGYLSRSMIFVIELTLNPPEGIIAGPVTEENYFEWEALITYVL